MSTKIKALIFDFDGLILDTESADFNSWDLLYQTYGERYSFEKWLTILGGDAESSFNPAKNLIALKGLSKDVSALEADAWQFKKKLLAKEVPLPGVLDMMDLSEKLGMQKAIASSSPLSWVERNLRNHNLFERFDYVVTADDVEKTKPSPDLFLLAAEKMNVAPTEVIVFEDSLNGVEAARRAGMFVVAIPNPLVRSLDYSHAPMRFESMADINLNQLIQVVEERV